MIGEQPVVIFDLKLAVGACAKDRAQHSRQTKKIYKRLFLKARISFKVRFGTGNGGNTLKRKNVLKIIFRKINIQLRYWLFISYTLSKRKVYSSPPMVCVATA